VTVTPTPLPPQGQNPIRPPLPMDEVAGHGAAPPGMPSGAVRGCGPRPASGPADAGEWWLVPPPADPAGEAEADAYFDWLLREVDAGREPVPDEATPPRAVVSLGEAADADPVVLGKMTGPDGLGGQGFRQDAMADAMRPGPLLGALAANAAADPAPLNDDELLGTVSAARRLRANADWMELNAIAEYILRNETRCTDSAARGAKRLRREGEFAREALGIELGISPRAAADRADLAVDLRTRLPCTFAGLRDGVITEQKATSVHRRTWYLTDEDAAKADELLAAAAPGLRPDSLDRKAVKLAYKLDPEAVTRSKEDGKTRRRVELRQEGSGNFSLAGRELDAAEAMAALNDITAEALRRQSAGQDGTLDEIRCRIYIDRLQGKPALAPAAEQAAAAGTPLPALINLIVNADTLLGLSETMSEADGYVLDGADSRAMIEAASRHPRTRWCVTVVDDKSREAVAHGCSRGRHPWKGPPTGRPGPEGLAGLLRELNVTFEPIARGTCDHRHREAQYAPSRKLKHLMHARTATCPTPGCEARAIHNEADHTIPWPVGETCEHNVSPPCGRHHHAKHAPGWKLEQVEPGVMNWTTPSGRVYCTRPTRYDT
jgi:Domain of unknown function (DUF222)